MSLGNGKAFFGGGQSTCVNHRPVITLGLFLTFRHGSVNILNHRVDVRNFMVGVRNGDIGIRNVMMNVRDSYSHVHRKFGLGVKSQAIAIRKQRNLR